MQTAESTEQDDEQETTQETTAATETATTTGETPAGDGGEGDTGEVVVTIGEESPPSEEEDEAASAPKWAKDLRVHSKEQAKRIRDLEAENAKLKAPPATDDEAVGPEPTLEGHDFDADKFKAAFTAWVARKGKADAKADEKAKADEEERKAWQAKQGAYGAAKTALKVPDADEAEAEVLAALSQTQQAILLDGAKNAALLVYALGKQPAKLKELAAIKNPVQFAFAAATLETQLKVTPKKAAPAPEKALKGNKSTTGAGDAGSILAKLEEEADRTGDRSKVIAFKRQHKAAAG